MTKMKEPVEDPAEEGRRQRRIAKAAKEAAFEFEKENNRYLYLYVSTGGWWKMGGRSALLYAHRLAPRIVGLKAPKILNDSDYYAHFKHGVVAIKDLERLEKNLETIKVKLKEKSDTYRIYDLGFKVTNAELKKLAKTELERKERINQIVIPEVVFPDINFHIVDIHKMVRLMVYKMPSIDQKFYGRPMLEQIQQMSVEYKMLANGEISVVSGLEQLLKRSRQLLYRLHDIVELGIEEPVKRLELARRTSELKRIIAAELRKEKRYAKAGANQT